MRHALRAFKRKENAKKTLNALRYHSITFLKNINRLIKISKKVSSK